MDMIESLGSLLPLRVRNTPGSLQAAIATAAGSTEGGPLVISVETSPLFNCLITYLTDFSNHNGNNCVSTQGAEQFKEKLRTSKDHPSTITVYRLLQAVKYLGPFF